MLENPILRCKTPDAWVEQAIENLDILLIDHAHCEKKAASSAMNLIFHYSEHYDLLQKMSRIVREEMRHFEQVLAILEKRNIAFKAIAPARYASGLRQYARDGREEKLIDLLIIGAFVEARSCERFQVIYPHLDTQLSKFYYGLLNSEARHFRTYLNFAKTFATEDIGERIIFFAKKEEALIMEPDEQFRFHSGFPKLI